MIPTLPGRFPSPFSPATRTGFVALVAFLLMAPCTAGAQQKSTLTYTDLMKVRQVEDPVISHDGRWVALAAVPDRGDGEVLVHSADGEAAYRVPLGSDPVISADGAWVAMRLSPSFQERETAEGGEAPRAGLALLSTATGEVTEWEDVRRFAFSADGAWLARLSYPPREGEEAGGSEAGRAGGGGEEGAEAGAQEQEEAPPAREESGTRLVLRELATGRETEMASVADFAFAETGAWLAYAVASETGEGDGLYLRALEAGAESRLLGPGSVEDLLAGGQDAAGGADPSTLQARAPFLSVGSMSWWEDGQKLAWVLAPEDEDGETGPGTLFLWTEDGVDRIVASGELREGWTLPAGNRLSWSQDGERLFYGTRPLNQAEEEWMAALEEVEEGEEAAGDEAAAQEAVDPYDVEAILEERGVDVWHTDDPLINPNQKQAWSREQARTYAAVYHLDQGRGVQLGDTLVQLQGTPDNPHRALASSPVPYLKERTWTGGAQDVYLVDLETGQRTLVVERFQGGGSAANSWVGVYGQSLSQSPDGRYVVWFMDDHWHLFDAETGAVRTLTEGMDVPFYDVDHDYPNPRGGHGVGGWVEDDRAVLIHDKYDVWRFPAGGGEPMNLTGAEGRSRGLILRVMSVDPEQEAFGDDEPAHLAAFDEEDKSFGFFRTNTASGGLETLLDEEKRFRVLAKARDAHRLLYTREAYDEFPDLWVADLDFQDRRRVTDVNPGLLEEFAWGSAELVEWTSDDGVPLQGVVIKPGNYEPGKRYPVLTYFYRFFSQRLHEFNEPVINHRPSFPIYASDGYLVFLPDVRFEVGRPGISSLKSVVPGVKKLVEMGLADPEALGLHGHSWSGYTTAYMVTQTNIFAAAVTGAPVSNMTSAYGGIRWGSGLARAFQYEMGQSRLRGSLWDDRPDYIENSPLFYADRVETPLVIMHGDEDGAVPWYQSIELYVALRRLGKDAVFLQYRGEPHHPQEYGNKLDYSLKMKAFFDHHLKGSPAPEWWSVGVPYSGK